MTPLSRWRWYATALGLCACTLHAQTTAPTTDHNSHHNDAPATTTADDNSTEGVIRRVDTAQNKVTIKHGEIRNLDMPPMTMVFQASDPVWLQNLQPGDRVRFTADLVNGEYTLRGLVPLQ